MIDQATSKNGLSIRLTAERWAHIAEEHGELASLREELLAVREIEPGKHLVVVYRELTDDGFIITAFVTRRMRSLARREQRWP
jgi:hypothetical protein